MGLMPNQSVLRAFPQLTGAKQAVPFGSGHIHDTFKVESPAGAFLLQRFNNQVFPQPFVVSENIQKVCQHLALEMEELYPLEAEEHYLSLIPTSEQEYLFQDREQNFWRVFRFQEASYAVDEVKGPAQAYEAAKAFGEFDRLLMPLDPTSFHESIPGFHNIQKRFQQFEQAAAGQVPGEAAELVAKARSVAPFVQEVGSLLARGQIPLRLVHNDTKINNVLLDEESHQGRCVIDLDTVMPGYFLYDYGDMVRTFVSPAAEDDTDVEQIYIREPIFKALTRGFLEELGPVITSEERKSLYIGARLLPLLMALRFLTDYLGGNHYYKIHYPTQNLDRSFNQFSLYDRLTEAESSLRKYIDS
jgi:hypothetical protein